MNLKQHIKYAALIALVMGSSACSVQRRLKKADNRYEVGEYNKASTMYKRVANKVKSRPTKAEVNYKMGECYRKVKNLTRANTAYRNAIKYGYKTPEAYFGYGEVLYEQNKIKDAKKYFTLCLEEDSTNSVAQNRLLACDSLAKWGLKTRYVVKIAKQFEERKSSNFCPAFISEDETMVYFSTNREGVTGGNAYSAITGQRPNDIYMLTKDLKNKWKEPEVVESINTEYDEGAISFTADGKSMYFTSARNDKETSQGAAIFMSKRKGAEWGEPEAVTILTDSLADTLTFAHPAISPTGLQLYFVSDMPGGHGGLDIWRVKQEGSGWGIPINLGGDVNTAGNEMFPFLRDDSTLYYSSNGAPGFGGLDIFKAVGVDSTWRVNNMGSPINSRSDDFGITFSKTEERGYFSTNRKERKGFDHIYSFMLPKLEYAFQGTITDDKSNEPIPGAVIKLVGDDGTNQKITTKKDGTYVQALKKDVDYVFMATARGYLNKSGEMNTLNIEKSILHKKNLSLSSIRQPIRLNNIFFDFASADLTEASSESLNALVKTLSDNPNITIEISAHSDAIGEDDVNIRISQARAESVVNYLVSHQVSKDRLTAIGYGETQPVVADKVLADQYKFVNEGDVLDEAFIAKLSAPVQEIANGINRRTVFKVLSTTYKSK